MFWARYLATFPLNSMNLDPSSPYLLDCVVSGGRIDHQHSIRGRIKRLNGWNQAVKMPSSIQRGNKQCCRQSIVDKGMLYGCRFLVNHNTPPLIRMFVNETFERGQ